MDIQLVIFVVGVCTFRCHATRDTRSEDSARQPVASWIFSPSNDGADLSSYGENPVTLTNVQYGPGPNGESNGAVTLPTNVDQSMIVMNPTDKLRFSSGMSYFTNVYLDGTKQGALFEYNSATTNNGDIGSLLWIWSGLTSLKVEKTGFDVEATDVLFANSWNQIAVVWDSSLLSFYVNGELVKAQSGSLDLSKTHVGHIHMGHRPGSASFFLPGRMACAKFFDVPLTEEEVLLMNCTDDPQESTVMPDKATEPVASWTFSESNGGADLSSFGENQVTLKNVQYGPGPNGEDKGAVILPSATDQSMIVLDPTDKLRFSSGMSYFTNVYLEGTQRGALFEYNDGITNDQGIGSLLWVWAGKTSLKVEKTGFDVEATNVLTAGSWNQIAVVWDSSLLSFYVNGELVKTQEGSLDLSKTQRKNIHMGYRPGAFSYQLPGRMACAKFYKVPLTAEQVRSLKCDGADIPDKCQGPKGDPGARGQPGPKGGPGLPGLNGEPGISGFSGAKGDVGSRGFPGLPGLNGLKGEYGLPGLDGISGMKGIEGPRGFPGVRGEKGGRGETIPGDKGEKGTQGFCDGDQCGATQDCNSNIAFTAVAEDVQVGTDDWSSVPLSEIKLNVGGALDANFATMTAPVRGIYAILVTARANGNGAIDLVLRSFNPEKDIFITGRRGDAVGPYPLGSNHAMIQLERGQQVKLLREPNGNSFWEDLKDQFKSPTDVTFTGYLVSSLEDCPE